MNKMQGVCSKVSDNILMVICFMYKCESICIKCYTMLVPSMRESWPSVLFPGH